MGENRWPAILTVMVIAILVTVLISGYIFVTDSSSEGPTGTQKSVVGCTFEYRIVGNYDDYNYYSGTETAYFIEESSTSYKIRTTVSLYKTSIKSGVSQIIEESETEDWVYRTAISSPGKYEGVTDMATYWGTQQVRSYVKNTDDGETRSFIGYGLVAMEKYIKTETSLKIYILSNTNYILDKKANDFGTYSVTMTTYGRITEKTVDTVSGSTQVKQIDTTGSCYKKYYHDSVSTGTDKKQTTYTKWVVRADDKEDYGTFVEKRTVSYTWGDVECNVYVHEEDALTTTSYVYQDKLLLKSNITGTSEGKRYEVYNNTTELIMNDSSVRSVADLDKLCSMM